MCRKSRSIDEVKRSFADRVEYVGQTQRVRLVPLGITPLAAGLMCFAASAAIGFAAIHTGAIEGYWADPGIHVKSAASLVLGLWFGSRYFHYFRKGNDRGRWDLILDNPKGTLQLPAIKDDSEPFLVQLSSIDRFQLKTIIKRDPSEGNKGFYRLSVVCRHQFGSTDDVIMREEFTDHPVAESHDEPQLIGMASWLEDLLETNLPVDSVDADFSLVSSLWDS